MLTEKSIQIFLKNLRFHAYIGVDERERMIGNEFEINLNITIPYQEGMIADDLNATISYAEVYEIVSEIMTKPRKLLERVAAEIIGEIKGKWPEIEAGEVEIIKTAPPIPGISGEVGVKLFF